MYSLKSDTMETIILETLFLYEILLLWELLY